MKTLLSAISILMLVGFVSACGKSGSQAVTAAAVQKNASSQGQIQNLQMRNISGDGTLELEITEAADHKSYDVDVSKYQSAVADIKLTIVESNSDASFDFLQGIFKGALTVTAGKTTSKTDSRDLLIVTANGKQTPVAEPMVTGNLTSNGFDDLMSSIYAQITLQGSAK
jgi:hypothetical protein